MQYNNGRDRIPKFKIQTLKSILLPTPNSRETFQFGFSVLVSFAGMERGSFTVEEGRLSPFILGKTLEQ